MIAYPTDSCYALGFHIGDKDALERVRRIRQADRHHHFTLVCRDLSEIAKYARVDTWQFRLLKACTPGAYTFLLPATRETAPPASAREAADYWHPGAGPPGAPRSAGGAGRAAHELDADAPGRRGAHDATRRRSGPAWSTRSTPCWTAATAAWSRPRWSTWRCSRRPSCGQGKGDVARVTGGEPGLRPFGYNPRRLFAARSLQSNNVPSRSPRPSVPRLCIRRPRSP